MLVPFGFSIATGVFFLLVLNFFDLEVVLRVFSKHGRNILFIVWFRWYFTHNIILVLCECDLPTD